MEKYNGNNGHRKRLRNRFAAGGMKAFAPHEILELFLQISIRRRDTKPTAKTLIDTFGSVGGALRADKEKMVTVKGIGERTAQLFEVFQKIEKQLARFEYPLYENGFEHYVSKITENDKNSEFYFAVTDGGGSVLYCRKLFDGSAQLLSDSGYFSDIARTSMSRNGSKVYIFQHRTSYETLKFYNEDIRTAVQLEDFLESVGLELADFIIICDGRFCSYNEQKRRVRR